MTETRFTLNNNVSNGTSNLNYLLTDEHEKLLRSFTPGNVESRFGPGDEACYEPSRGYTDPEWYWEESNGCVWGIGWRWGSPRLRGRGGGRMENRVHPDKDSAAEFIEFLINQVRGK